MKVDRIRLRNFKCYGEADLDLDRGVTVVHGVNGSGKSTLLEAVFFALYGSKALDNRTLDDVITTGADDAEVELEFTHDGRAFHVERHLTLRGDRASTTKCVLETGTETIEGARDVRAEITTLLRMDADAFVNCAYVRQGEVNKLIHASPGERQDMIDDLLQLGALEEYRERASDARLGVKTVLDGQREVIEDVHGQVETKEEKDLHERLNGLESKTAELGEQIGNYESQREHAQRTLETAEDVLDRHEETRAEIETLGDEIETLRSKISETERDRDDAKDEIRSLESRREELEEERSALLADSDLEDGADIEAIESHIDDREKRDDELRDELEEVHVSITETNGNADRLREEAADLESRASDAREEIADLESRLEADEETITEREEKLADLDGEIESARATFDDAEVAFGETESYLESLRDDRDELVSEINDVTAEIKTVENAIEEGTALLEAGKCPECGQPVEDSPHVNVLDDKRDDLETLEERLESLENDRDELDERIERADARRESERRLERLEENRENASQLLAEKREAVQERREQREQLRENVETYEREVAEKREKAEELTDEVETLQAEIGEINSERGEISTRLETLERLTEIRDERAERLNEIETLRERRSDWRTLNDERREQLSDKRDRKEELEAEFDEERVATAREDRESAREYLEKVDEKLTELRERRDEVQNAIGAVENELDELDRLRERLERLRERCDRLESLYEEAETLQTTYGDLRAELRQRNVETLERLLNETFDLVYQNDSYASIDLDGEYRLTVYQKDGEPLEPEQLSGGERALFNLSLRCAIYRLLAEGVEGNAPMPPLILDEPTVFLDSGHVTQLVSLVESMRNLGVEQILVVSHDEELVGAADSIVRVEKDATSNRSRLERRSPPETSLLTSET
ncbi:DNA double-strand break repair Rad50 ATPase [Natrarchaeobius halalkaliphilus]|uniref:DNA double-strand break repair Rad50 ATPase n=1 Tax=Natrarchaeobius halalkaliphilus TaxID=1679091 RepID=A0A3N6P402_9EURY|nr:DNA double-strand break repair ATPase Rad50 [Natrarchaeobius halalkaliphilus]RQG90105.1 DNA double-strand break repair Rad50 ATPase [Natrarchaeobius halalkaliphilus]